MLARKGEGSAKGSKEMRQPRLRYHEAKESGPEDDVRATAESSHRQLANSGLLLNLQAWDKNESTCPKAPP